MRLLTVLLVVAMLKPSKMIAESVDIGKSGTDFLAACSVFGTENGDQAGYDTVHCVSWVEGFVNGVIVTEEFLNTPEKDKMFCSPQGVTYIQIGRIIRKYISEHPERQHLPTRFLSSEAVVGAFPCKK